MSAAALVGFAFAKADLLVALDAGPGRFGRVSLAIGDARVLGAPTEAALTAQGLDRLIHPDDLGLLHAFLAEVRPGRRRDGLLLRLSPRDADGAAPVVRWTEMSVFRMPGAGSAFQCVFNVAPAPREAGPILDPSAFIAAAVDLAASRAPDRALGLGLVETGGREDMGPDAVDRLRAAAHEGRLLTGLDAGRFALIGKAEAVSASAAAWPWRSRLIGMDAATAGEVRGALTHVLADFGAHGLDAIGFGRLSEVGPALSGIERAERDAVHNAVRAGAFTLFFQPIVSLRTGRLHHYEALIRFPGRLPPRRAIAVAEQSGVIAELDLAVVRRVLTALKRQGDLRVALNLSAASLASPGFRAALARALHGAGDVEGRLIFEIRAASIAGDITRLHDQLAEIRAEGGVFCLDDFGSGTLSLAALERLPLDMVKFDGPLIRELSNGGRSDIVIRHLVGLCNDLHIKTAAEMVEDIGCETAVMEAGLDFAQGWLYGRAAEQPRPPSNDLADRVTARRIAPA